MNEYRIPLTRGKFALVDKEDFDRYSAYRWHATTSGGNKFYAARKGWDAGKSFTILLHREIIGAAKGEDVDHINADSLDCRRANLRRCTRRQNMQNNRKRSGYRTSQYKGVGLHQKNKKWQAKIAVNGKSISLGYYHSEIDAALAYNDGARKYFGEFARLNSIHVPTGGASMQVNPVEDAAVVGMSHPAAKDVNRDVPLRVKRGKRVPKRLHRKGSKAKRGLGSQDVAAK